MKHIKLLLAASLILLILTLSTLTESYRETDRLSWIIESQDKIIANQGEVIEIQHNTISVYQLIAEQEKTDTEQIKRELEAVAEWLGKDVE